MDNKWVKLSLTFIKSHPLLPLCFYSLSYLLPICLHWPLLRRGAPLIPSQNRDSWVHSLPSSIPFKNLRSEASPPANHGWTCPNSIPRSNSSLFSSLPVRETAKSPHFHLLWMLPFAQKAGTYHHLSLLIGISPAWVFSSWTEPASVPALFSSWLSPQFQHCSPHCTGGWMLCTTPTPILAQKSSPVITEHWGSLISQRHFWQEHPDNPRGELVLPQHQGKQSPTAPDVFFWGKTERSKHTTCQNKQTTKKKRWMKLSWEMLGWKSILIAN